MNVPVNKLADFKIHKFKDRVEATTELHWYATAGYYKIDVVGLGRTEFIAKENALAMAIRARTELQFATIDSVHRVSETQTGDAHERSGEPVQGST